MKRWPLEGGRLLHILDMSSSVARKQRPMEITLLITDYRLILAVESCLRLERLGYKLLRLGAVDLLMLYLLWLLRKAHLEVGY